MKYLHAWQALAIAGLSLLTIASTSLAQAPTPAPLTPAQISLAEEIGRAHV